MFLHLSVIMLTGGMSVTPGQTPLLPADTPPGIHHLGQTPPLGRHTPAKCMLGYTPCPVHAGIHPLPSACWDTHPPAQCMLGYGQQAGGTHPTGMHSC